MIAAADRIGGGVQDKILSKENSLRFQTEHVVRRRIQPHTFSVFRGGGHEQPMSNVHSNLCTAPHVSSMSGTIAPQG